MIRLFIAVLVPENIRELITDLITELKSVRGLPPDIRFAPPENWHFTLTFLGYQPESAVPLIKEVLFNFRVSQTLRFGRVVYGPPPKGPLRGGHKPRMIWLTTARETSEELGKIKKELEDKLETKSVKWRRELRPYQGHITLARFPETPLKNLPPIEKEINWRYEAREIHLMKSTLKRTGAEYEVLL